MRCTNVCLSILLAVAAIAGCASDMQVSTIQVGRSLNADNTVANHTTVFKPQGTVYVSVLTSGSGSGTITVRWIYEGTAVGEQKKAVAYRGNAATEFHLQNAGGFPPGEYTAEVLFDGKPAGAKKFRVEKN